MKQHHLFSALLLTTALAVNAAGAFAQAGHGGGGDIVVFDIVDSSHDRDSASRPAGGGDDGGGGDIIVWDIIESAHDD